MAQEDKQWVYSCKAESETDVFRVIDQYQMAKIVSFRHLLLAKRHIGHERSVGRQKQYCHALLIIGHDDPIRKSMVQGNLTRYCTMKLCPWHRSIDVRLGFFRRLDGVT